MSENMNFDLPNNGGKYPVQVFTFRKAIQSGTSYTPLNHNLVHLGADVDITIDGVATGFNKGDKIVLIKGKEYIFSLDIALGLA